MRKSIFEVITEYGMDEGVNDMLMKNEEYGKIKEKEERLAREVDGFGLTEEQRLTLDRLISSCNESGALYGKMTYQQGVRDCAALLLEIGMINGVGERGITHGYH